MPHVHVNYAAFYYTVRCIQTPIEQKKVFAKAFKTDECTHKRLLNRLRSSVTSYIMYIEEFI